MPHVLQHNNDILLQLDSLDLIAGTSSGPVVNPGFILND